MTIYQPYFYIIQEVSTGMYYAGAKWAKDANPDNFMIEGGYTTSSSTIKHHIQENGLKSFIIRKIKIFDNSKDAHDYETKFLQKINARNNPNFYNAHNNEYMRFTPGSDEWISMFRNKYGVDNPLQIPEIKCKVNATKKEKYGSETYNNREKAKETMGVSSPAKNPSTISKGKATKKEKYGSETYNNREKAKETTKMRFGVEHHMKTETSKNNKSNTMNERYGVSYSMQAKELQQKHEECLFERYGVRCTFHIPEVNSKIKIKNEMKLDRSIVDELRSLAEIHQIKLGYNWSRKSDEWIINKIEELKNIPESDVPPEKEKKEKMANIFDAKTNEIIASNITIANFCKNQNISSSIRVGLYYTARNVRKTSGGMYAKFC